MWGGTSLLQVVQVVLNDIRKLVEQATGNKSESESFHSFCFSPAATFLP